MGELLIVRYNSTVDYYIGIDQVDYLDCIYRFSYHHSAQVK